MLKHQSFNIWICQGLSRGMPPRKSHSNLSQWLKKNLHQQQLPNKTLRNSWCLLKNAQWNGSFWNKFVCLLACLFLKPPHFIASCFIQCKAVFAIYRRSHAPRRVCFDQGFAVQGPWGLWSNGDRQVRAFEANCHPLGPRSRLLFKFSAFRDSTEVPPFFLT